MWNTINQKNLIDKDSDLIIHKNSQRVLSKKKSQRAKFKNNI